MKIEGSGYPSCSADLGSGSQHIPELRRSSGPTVAGWTVPAGGPLLAPAMLVAFPNPDNLINNQMSVMSNYGGATSPRWDLNDRNLPGLGLHLEIG
jgi:hypothetical protein